MDTTPSTVNSGTVYDISKNLIVYLICCDVVGRVLDGLSENAQLNDVDRSVLIYQAVTTAARNNVA